MRIFLTEIVFIRGDNFSVMRDQEVYKKFSKWLEDRVNEIDYF